MNQTTLVFFQIIRQSIGLGEAVLTGEAVDWKQIYRDASLNKLEGIVYNAVMHAGKNQLDQSILHEWKNKSLLMTFNEARKYTALQILTEEAEKRGLTPVFFKGALIARLYPNPLLRVSGDTDVFIYPEDREAFLQILQEQGYEYQTEPSKEMVPVYFNPAFNHKIEVHYSLWEDYTGPQMDMLDQMNLTAKDSLVQETVKNFQVLTMSHEKHLIYQMFHIIKHFSTQFVNVRYLVDLTLFVNAHWDQIDGAAFWNSMDRLGYAVFCKTFFEIAVEHLGMRPEILNNAKQVQSGDAQRLIGDMLTRGGNTDQSGSWQIYSIITPYLQGDVRAAGSGVSQKLGMIFPRPEALPQWCGYARKYPVLLPVAWIHKMAAWLFRYLRHQWKKKDGEEREMYTVSEKIAAASQRLDLMKEMKLL